MSIADAGYGAGLGAWTNTRDVETIRERWDRFEDRAAEAVYGFVSRAVQFSFWVLEWLRVTYPVEWFRWHTAADERTCPVCAPREGEQWPEDRAPEGPPLHTNCRCFVAWAFTEWRFRWVQEWRLRWGTRYETSWERTGQREQVTVRWRRTVTKRQGLAEWQETTWF